ncbi:MAG: hypothetical protein IKF41_01515 [Alphaproteobacteria bacterium]|nr:hypothetical protein [Alphaproteobacteria bacterium]
MKKGFFFFVVSVLVATSATAVDSYVPKKFNTITSHNDVYPYVLNNTKTNTNAKNISATTASARRAVVPRSGVMVQTTPNTQTQQPRRVVQRTNTKARAANPFTPGTNINYRAATAPVRVRNVNTARTTTNNYYTATERPSSQRCMADYKECMEDYCKREDTAYNRCYCSAKLAQIDAKYKNKIEELIEKIVRLKYSSSATSEEIKEYWDQTVGVQTGDNPWVNIDNALNIEWANTESRVRGQNAFNTGHQYCSQHLRACYYMASNLRDAYKSEIARDCETYEKSLQKIQDAAESVIESYND